MKYLKSPGDPFEKFQKSDYSTTRRNIEEKMAKMRKIIKSPLSKRKQSEGNASLNTSKTFGVSLDELLERNSEDTEIPYALDRITEYIKCYGMKHEGIFRVNGNAKVMEKLKMEFDKVGDADLENLGDVMSVAGLMKMFLRELPEPLIPRHFKQAFMQVHKEYSSDRNECCGRMRDLAAELPRPRNALLKFLCHFLVEISLHTDFNKMNANSLAIVFSPNLFRCSEGIDGFREQAVTNSIVRMFIEEYDSIFKDEHEEPPSLTNFIQVQEAMENSFTSPPAMPIPYEQHKKLKKHRDRSSPLPETPDMITPYAEYRVGEDNHLIIIGEPKPKVENHIYASVSKAQRESILSSTCDHLSDEAEPYIRSNSPSWHKPNDEPSSPKMESSPKSRKEYMEKTIKESIKEHLFGHNLTSTSEESDKWDSPGEEAPPVPPKIPELLSPEDNTPRSQKRKKRRGSKSSQESVKASSGDDADLKDVVDGGNESETLYEHKSDQELDQSVVRSPKRQHRSKAVDMESREPLMINVVDYDSSERLFLKKESSSSNAKDQPCVSQKSELFAVKSSEVLTCLTRHRAPPPRQRRPPSLKRRQMAKIDMKASDPEIKTDLKQLPRKPPSPPPRPNLSPSNSISPAAASKIERRKQVRSMPELPKGGIDRIDRDIELDSEGGSCQSDSPTADSPVLTLNLKRSECIPIIPPLELYKLGERTEDDPMISPRERYDAACNFDDAMISPRSRRNFRGFASECPPSPPAKQENHFWMEKKPNTSPKAEPSLKELSKRAKSIKKKIKDYEEKFEDENGYKPTQSQDRAPIKKYVSDLHRTQRQIQELKEKRLSAQERMPVEATVQTSSHENDKAAEPLLTTLPGTVEQSLENALKKLKEKRGSSGRPDNVDEMTRDQLQDEKLAVQKALLQHENTFGRPTTKRDKDTMKPLYDRYRTIKRKITNYSLKDFSGSPQSSKAREKTGKRKMSPERPTELDMTSVSQVDTLGSTASETVGRLAQSLPARTSTQLFDKDMSPVSPLTVCVDDPGNSTIDVEDPGGGDDLPDGGGRLLTAKEPDTKDPDAILHQASTDDLLEQKASASRRKKKLGKKLKLFEDSFAKRTGRKVQKEDRGPHEEDYEEYKKIKARLRLLDALITKQRGNNTI